MVVLWIFVSKRKQLIFAILSIVYNLFRRYYEGEYLELVHSIYFAGSQGGTDSDGHEMEKVEMIGTC